MYTVICVPSIGNERKEEEEEKKKEEEEEEEEERVVFPESVWLSPLFLCSGTSTHTRLGSFSFPLAI